MAPQVKDCIFVGLLMSFFSFGMCLFTTTSIASLELTYGPLSIARSIHRRFWPICKTCDESEVEWAQGVGLGDRVVISGNGRDRDS
jgi:hypothetical protein